MFPLVFIKESGGDIPGYFEETFMIIEGKEKRSYCSDNALLITELVRFSVLFAKLHYIALVRKVNL